MEALVLLIVYVAACGGEFLVWIPQPYMKEVKIPEVSIEVSSPVQQGLSRETRTRDMSRDGTGVVLLAIVLRSSPVP